MALRSSIHDPLPIEIQLQQERATALRRTGDKLETLIAEIHQAERELRTLIGPTRAAKVARYQQMRSDAEYQRWCLVVQREAMGLWNHGEVDLMYPIPAPVKA